MAGGKSKGGSSKGGKKQASDSKGESAAGGVDSKSRERPTTVRSGTASERRLLGNDEVASRKPRGILGWFEYKYMQYNVTSCLYMLDWWERMIFNTVLASIFFATILAMVVYFQDSVPLFFLGIFLFGFTMFLLLLCPLHQY